MRGGNTKPPPPSPGAGGKLQEDEPEDEPEDEDEGLDDEGAADGDDARFLDGGFFVLPQN